MKTMKRVTTLLGVVALSASMLLANDASAQQISTTLTVENSTPACVDATPTSLTMSQSTNTPQTFGGALTGGTPTTSFTAKETPGSVYMHLYVNECLGQGWTVTAAITDFHSGANAVPAAGKLQMYAQSGSAQFNIDYTRPVRPTGTQVSPYSPSRWVPGTTGLPVGFTSGRTFSSAGSDLSVASGHLSTGTVESTGEMVQAFKMRLSNVPTTTAPGTYSADMTLTFTSTGP